MSLKVVKDPNIIILPPFSALFRLNDAPFALTAQLLKEKAQNVEIDEKCITFNPVYLAGVGD